MKKVSIIIPVINLWNEYTIQCLCSIKTIYPFRILLIDNGSSDETEKEYLSMIMAAEDKYDYIKNAGNIGVSKSWNLGIKDSFDKGYDYVFIINNDVIFHEQCIDRLVDRLNKGNVVLASALDVRGECQVPEEVYGLKLKVGLKESQSPNFSAFMITKELIEKVGWFDEGFDPAYFEDNDMHYRIKTAGLKAVCHPLAMFYHFGSRTQGDIRYPGGLVPGSQFLQCRDYFIQKWGGEPGSEKFNHPFGDASKSVKWVKQDGI